MVIKEGLQIAVDRNFQYLELEFDSMVALYLLENNVNEKIKFLNLDCRFLIQKMVSMRLQHIFGEGNKIVD